VPHEFLADRNLGKRVVATLRGAGHTVHTLADVFGESGAQLVPDEDWIVYAGGHRWAALTKDSRIRQRPAERDAVTTHDVLLFALANANLGFSQMADALLAAMPHIHAVCDVATTGAIWVVQRDGSLRHVWPPAAATTL
jgi:hypothetical protein